MLARIERGAEKADHQYRPPLRPRREWPPGCRAGEHTEKFAPPHCVQPQALVTAGL